ncbi:MAG: hypothetical protein OEM62_10815 [Acidobacteriota bacterium]|nr:hypothetical protein [Acidobacteriota bacterium]
MKKIVVCLGLFALGFAVTLAITRWRATAPFDTAPPVGPALVDELVEAGDVLAAFRGEMVGSASAGRVATVRLDDSALRSVLLAAIGRSAAGHRVLDGMRRMDVGIGRERLEIDLELDSAVLTGELSDAAGDAVQLLVKVAGLASGGDFGLELSGVPEARNGKLGLAPETLEVRINRVRLPITRLAERLRTSPASLEQSIFFEIEAVHVDDAYLENGRLILRGRPY